MHCNFQVGWFANPVYNGDYPIIMKERIAYRSQLEGLKQSRLPTFTEDEKDYIRGTNDVFGIQTYNKYIVSNSEEPALDGSSSWDKDTKVIYIVGDTPEVSFFK